MTDRRFINYQYLDSGGARLKVECRFCTHKQQFNKFQHVAPCGCIGNTRYVHKRCLQNWFIIKFQHAYNQAYEGDPLDFNVFCQICQQKMEIEFSLTKKCSKYDEILQKLEEDKFVLVVVLLIAVALIALLIFIIVFSQISYVNSNLLAIIISVCLIALVGDISFFCAKFLLIKSIDIDYIPNHKDPPKLLAFAEEDINNVEQLESQRNQPHFGQALSRNPADKSLMLESNKNCGSQKRSSLQSKTFTDIVMRQMYQHDLPSQREKTSNQIQINDNIDQREKYKNQKNKTKTEKQIKKRKYQKEYIQQSVQVTAFQEKKESTNQTKHKQNQKEEKSVQMSRQQNSFRAQHNSKSKSKKIFDKPSQARVSDYKKDTIRREDKNLVEEEEQDVKQRVFQPKNSEQQFELKKYKIKQKSSSQEQFRPTLKKIEMIEQKQSASVSKSSNRLKLKNLKDPIKIKIRF